LLVIISRPHDCGQGGTSLIHENKSANVFIYGSRKRLKWSPARSGGPDIADLANRAGVSPVTVSHQPPRQRY